MTTTVEPSTFSYVDFDAGRIATLTDELAGRIGLGDVSITVEVDETSLLGHTDLVSVDPIHIRTESGALEDRRRIRTFSAEAAADVLGRYLLRASDRRSPRFADAPADEDLSVPQRTAWDINTVGRFNRLGYSVRRQRWLYAFRNRHGFTDAADQIFETLWNAAELTWADVERLSAEAEALNPGPLSR